VVLSHFNQLRSNSDFMAQTPNIVQNAINNATQTNTATQEVSQSGRQRIIIGGRKLNFNNQSPLKQFNNLADNIRDRTMYAIEDQQFEDWVDAIDKIFKMLRNDFFGTIKKFLKFLINLSKPLEIEDFEAKWAKVNARRQQIEVEQMVEKLKEQNSSEFIALEGSTIPQLPTKITKIAGTGLLPKSTSKTIITLKKTTEEEFVLSTTEIEISESNELSDFEKLEQRLLSKLKDSGSSHYDLWLDLAELYIKNNSQSKAREIYTYVAKNSKDILKQKAINGIIGLD
jgi:hypothetical protein